MSAIFELARARGLTDSLMAGGAVFGPLAIASMALTALGTGISAAGSIAAGQNAAALGQFQQKEYGEQAMNDVATSQRKMLDEQRKGKEIQSQLVARAAGNGLNPSVGSVVGLSSQIAGRSTYNSLMDLSQGRNAAAGLTNMGSAARYQGDLTNSLAPMEAIGTIASGAGSMFMTAAKNPSAFSWGGSSPSGGSAPMQLPYANPNTASWG
jgi:hypothetical protein